MLAIEDKSEYTKAVGITVNSREATLVTVLKVTGYLDSVELHDIEKIAITRQSFAEDKDVNHS